MYRKSRADIVIMLSTFLIVVVVVVCRRQSLRHPGGAEGAGGHGSLARHRRPARRRAQSRVDELGRRPQPVRRHRRLLLPRQPARHALAVGQPALQLHRVSVATTSRRPRDDLATTRDRRRRGERRRRGRFPKAEKKFNGNAGFENGLKKFEQTTFCGHRLAK